MTISLGELLKQYRIASDFSHQAIQNLKITHHHYSEERNVLQILLNSEDVLDDYAGDIRELSRITDLEVFLGRYLVTTSNHVYEWQYYVSPDNKLIVCDELDGIEIDSGPWYHSLCRMVGYQTPDIALSVLRQEGILQPGIDLLLYCESIEPRYFIPFLQVHPEGEEKSEIFAAYEVPSVELVNDFQTPSIDIRQDWNLTKLSAFKRIYPDSFYLLKKKISNHGGTIVEKYEIIA